MRGSLYQENVKTIMAIDANIFGMYFNRRYHSHEREYAVLSKYKRNRPIKSIKLYPYSRKLN